MTSEHWTRFSVSKNKVILRETLLSYSTLNRTTKFTNYALNQKDYQKNKGSSEDKFWPSAVGSTVALFSLLAVARASSQKQRDQRICCNVSLLPLISYLQETNIYVKKYSNLQERLWKIRVDIFQTGCLFVVFQISFLFDVPPVAYKAVKSVQLINQAMCCILFCFIF
jgi:hypothetical protein